MKLDTAIKIIPQKYFNNITEVILKDRADGVYYTISLDSPMPDGWKEGVLSVAYNPFQDKYIVELEYSAKELRSKHDYSETRTQIEEDFTNKITELQLLKEI
jgi:hypothetical protein